MKIIAIYNEPDFHYEVFGFVFECAKRNGFHVDVYCTMDKKWIDFYKNLFHHIDFYDIEKTHIRPKSYDAIILTTHSNKIEKTNKVLSIAHLIPGSKQQNGFNSRIPIDYKYKYCMIRRVLPSFILNVHNCFSYNFPKHSISNNPSWINICMVGGVAGNDWDILRKLAKNPDIFIHYVNRHPSDKLQKIFKDRMKEYIKASPSKLFSIIHSCDFLLVAKKIESDYTHIQMSGSIPIAISTLTPIISSDEMINSLDLNSVAIGYSEDFVFSSSNLKRYLLKYNEKNLKSQREILIEDTGRTMKQLFPKLYIEEQTVNTKIPKIINFMWIQKDDKNSSMGPPKKYEKQIKSWKIRNPEYKVIIWKGKDIKKLLSKYLSDDILHILYNRIPAISLCDISRSLMIYELGGLYTDLDFHCCKRIDKLLSTHSTYFIREPPEHEIEGKHLCTGFLGAVPKNNFMYEWFKHQIENIQKFNNENLPLNKVVSTTGPRAFWEFYQKNNFDIYIGDYCDILPILDNQKVSKKCLNTEPYTYNAWNEGTGWGIISIQKYTNIIFIVLLLLLIASTLLLLFSK